MKKKRVLLNFCVLAFLVNAMMVPINSFQAPLVSEVFGQGSELLSLWGIAVVLGMGVGSALYPYISKTGSVRNLVFLHGIGMSVSSIFMILGSLVKENWVAVYVITALGYVGMGFFASILSSILSVQFLKSVEQDYLARAQSLLNAGATAAMPVTSILLGVVVNYVSVKGIIIVCGIISALLFVMFRICNMKFEEKNEERNHVL